MKYPIELHLLGSPQVFINNELLSHKLTHKTLGLLYFLATENIECSRDTLAALFWGDVKETNARGSLRFALSSLHKLLGDALQINWYVAMLDASKCRVDVHTFLDLLQHLPRDAASFDQRVLDLYRGDFLAGFHVRNAPMFDEWQRSQQQRLRLQASDALSKLVAQYIQQGEYSLASSINQKLLDLDALNETTHQQQMILYMATGQRSLAVQQYRICTQILKKELGITPSKATVELLQQARQEIDNLLPSSTNITAAPPKANLPALISHVHFWSPTPLISMFGRKDQIQRVINKLVAGEERLISLVGISGMGKTLLAKTIGARLASTLQNGVCFITIADDIEAKNDQTAELRLALLLKAAFNIEDNQSDVIISLQSFLRTKELLLILDNCEQMHDAMTLTLKLLEAAPRLRILTTSYEPLGLRMENIEPVVGLPQPSPTASLEELESNPAIQLYTARARRVYPQFVLNDKNSVDIIRICRLVEGLPLALELAAGWVSLYTSGEIADLIEQRAEALTSSFVDYPDRHRSISALFDYIWKLLKPEEKRIFSGMAIFTGGSTRQAILEIVKADLYSLTVLLQRGLMHTEVDGRFACHTLMSELARKQLKADATHFALLQERHCVYYAGLVGHSLSNPGRKIPSKQVLDQIELDMENIFSAWDYALHKGDYYLFTDQLERLYEFFNRRERLQEGEILLTETISKLQTSNTVDMPMEQIALLGHLYKYVGQINNKRGQWRLSQSNLEQGLTLMRQAHEDNTSEFALGQAFLAYSMAQQDASTEALRLAQQAVTMLRDSDDFVYLVDALLSKSAIYHVQSQMEQAEKTCQEALQTAKQAHYPLGVAKTLTNLGYILASQGKFDEAEAAWQQCLSIFRAETMRRSIAQVLNNLGYLYVLKKGFSQARPLLEEALALARQLGISGIEAEVMDSFGRMAYEEGDLLAARRYYTQALSLVYHISDERKCADYLFSVANVYIAEGLSANAYIILKALASYPLINPNRQERISELLNGLQNQTADVPPPSLQPLTLFTAGTSIMNLAYEVITLPLDPPGIAFPD